MGNIRARTNHAFITHMIQNGDKAMKHPDFNDQLTNLYAHSCHQPLIGNTFQRVIYSFINYPEIGVFSVVWVCFCSMFSIHKCWRPWRLVFQLDGGGLVDSAIKL